MRLSISPITGAGGSPVTALAPESIVLDFADERSFVQTRFATSALMLLRAHLGGGGAQRAPDRPVHLAHGVRVLTAAVPGIVAVALNRFIISGVTSGAVK